jgi:hypothetical protein
VQITLTNERTGVVQRCKSDGAGLYSLPYVQPGKYSLSAEAAGFKRFEEKSITVETAQNLALDVKLQVGGANETVTVSGSTIRLNTTDGSVGTAVDRQFVATLPLNGRSFSALYLLIPGVEPTTGSGAGTEGQYAVNGQRPTANQYQIDGVSANYGVFQTATLASTAAGSLPATSSTGGTNSLLSEDALEEFQVQTSTFAPEYGRTAGAQVEITSRSGSNAFHGTAFDYLRNEAFDANDWFNNFNHIPRQPHRQNDFGGVLGGPIVRNKTFFFVSYEALRLTQPQTLQGLVPSQSTRLAAPNAQMQTLLNMFPIPNGPVQGTTGLATFIKAYATKYNVDSFSVRIDHRVNANVQMFARYSHAPSNQQFPQSLNVQGVRQYSNDALTGGTTWAISPRFANEFRANWARAHVEAEYTATATDGAVLPAYASLMPGRSPNNSYFSNNLTFGNDTFVVWGKNADNYQHQLNFTDSLTFVNRTHQIKVGFDYRRLAPQRVTGGYLLQYSFNNLTSVLNGDASTASVTNQIAATLVFPTYGIYAQDAWKATRKLNLTYGLRWDVAPAPTFTQGPGMYGVTQISDLSNLALAPAGTSLYRTDWGSVAPRVGFAYSLLQAKDFATVLRGGFGIFYDVQNPLVGYMLGTTPPSSASVTYPNAPYPLTGSQLVAPSVSTTPPFSNFESFDPHLKNQRYYQWNLSIEQQLGEQQSLSLTYVGAAGRDLYRQIVAANPNPSFLNEVTIGTNKGNSDYDALQVQFKRRLSRGLQALASYTWAHSIDNGSAYYYGGVLYGIPLPNYDTNRDRASSDFDIRQTFTMAAHYDLPELRTPGFTKYLFEGWSIDPIFRAQGAMPVDVYSEGSVQGVTLFPRPDLVAGQPLYLHGPQYPGGKAFNPVAVSNVLTGVTQLSAVRQGTTPRNHFRGFGHYEPDLSIARTFPVYERVKLQFRGDIFNLVNAPEFANPSNQVGTGTFGITTQSFASTLNGFTPIYQFGGPRSIQLSLKLIF